MSTTEIKEQWRPIRQWEGLYEVSDLGRVRRVAAIPAHRCNRVLRPRDNGHGYVQVRLRRPGTKLNCYVHILVAAAFIGECPPEHEVNHINLDRSDCRATNLEYLTRPDNVRHSMRCNPDGRPSKLTEEDVREIRQQLQAGQTQRPLARKYGVDRSTIARIHTGKIWGHLARMECAVVIATTSAEQRAELDALERAA